MSKWHKAILKILLAFTLTTSSIYIFAPWEYGVYYLKPLSSSVESEAQLASENGIDGIIIYTQTGNEPGQTVARGWHNRAAAIPAYGQALFKIASIAKLYEAAAITKLIATNQLDANQSVAHYLPQLASRIEYADQITIKMLVMHRSGVPNFTDQPGFDWASNDIDVFSLMLDKPADFKPDTDYAYSNSNYLLLTQIMNNVLGYDYTQFIQANILKPLALKHTFFSIHDVDMDELMSGYYVGYDDDLKYLDQGYVASARDVGVFIRALNEGTLFTAEEADIYASLYDYGHTGWVLGYSSIARYHKDTDTVVIQFTNTTGDDRVLLTQIIYARILDILNKAGD
ncbi:MAG: serine hydrolase domain-containing protein [Glaciecola sp.]